MEDSGCLRWELPERLLELLQIDITPQDLDLTKARGRGRNAKAVVAAFQYVFRELHHSQILSAKRIRGIFENCIEHGQIDESMRYTAYDIAMKQSVNSAKQSEKLPM